MNLFFLLTVAYCIVDIVGAERALLNTNNDEPTPEELFGLLGIFPSFCESKIGQKFVKCATEPPTGGGMMGGKGMSMGRRRTTTTEGIMTNLVEEDLIEAFNTLSSDDKKRLLHAFEQNDVDTVDTIFDKDTESVSNTNERTLGLNHNNVDEQTPEELFLGGKFCDTKLGKKFVKCVTEPPVGGKMGGMGGMGKRQQRQRHLLDYGDIMDVYETLSKKDQYRLLNAIEMDDEKVMVEILGNVIGDLV